MRRHPAMEERPLIWMGSSKRVVGEIGYALSWAQFGRKHSATKHWRGVGARVLEVVEDFDGNAYRAVYTVRFERAVYVLHCFQKKSPTGIKTARPDVEMVRKRLAAAEADYKERNGQA
jgi:phage-related protein